MKKKNFLKDLSRPKAFLAIFLATLLITFLSTTKPFSFLPNLKFSDFSLKEKQTEEVEKSDSNIEMALVSVNNETVDFNEETISVETDDVVRVSGHTIPSSKLLIHINEKEIETTADEVGNWFVLFSITNMEEKNIEIKAQTPNMKKGEVLTSLIIEDHSEVVLDATDKETFFDKILTKDSSWKIFYIILIIIAVLPTSIIVFRNRKQIIKKLKQFI